MMIGSQGPEEAIRPEGAEQEPTFSAPWQARAFAITVALHQQGRLDWTEWARAFSAELARSEKADPEGHDYYACWLRTLECLLIEKRVLSRRQLGLKERRLQDDWPHPDHVARREPIARSLPSDG